MDAVASIVEAAGRLERGETLTWQALAHKQTLAPFVDVRVLEASLQQHPRPVCAVEISRRKDGRFLAHIHSVESIG